MIMFKKEIAERIGTALRQRLEIEDADVLALLEMPPDSSLGDYAFPCFRFAKGLKEAPAAVAQWLAACLDKPEYIEKIELKGPYINFFISQPTFCKEVLTEVAKQKENFGCSTEGTGKTVVIDYSSPNIAKPFHVGHLRSTVIGGALYQIYKKLGYQTIGVNHLGDWGTQFGKLIVAFQRYSSREAVEQHGIKELMRIYVVFHQEAEKDPSMEEEARGWFVKMQQQQEEALALWKWFYDVSMSEFKRVYEFLGITFDAYTGESFYNDKMDAVVTELKEKHILQESDGAQIVDLEQESMPPCLILRKDGGTLYATRDIAAAIYRKETYDFYKCLYVTGMDQILHFRQWFEVVNKMGRSWASSLIHVPFGLVSLDSGKLSTRSGNVVLMEDLLLEAVEKTKKIIEEKNPDLHQKDEVAKQVGVGAVIFNDLYNSRMKDVVFSYDKMLSFDGETGPYVQYTHVRACSVLVGQESVSPEEVDFTVFQSEAEHSLCKLLYQYPEKIKEAAEKNEPFILSRHIMDIAQAFNKFYHDLPVRSSEGAVKKGRLLLVSCVKTVLSSALSMLLMDAPEQM